MISWPTSLVREVANRRCAFFLGAGVSATAVDSAGVRPKDWGEFLKDACGLVHDTDKRVQIETLVTERRYLLALQAIKLSADRGDYQDLLNRNFNSPAFQPSKLHETILALDSRIVITTNFDKIYERYCLNTSREGFKVVTYESPSYPCPAKAGSLNVLACRLTAG